MCIQESGYLNLELSEFVVPGDTAVGTACRVGRARDSRAQLSGGLSSERAVAFPSLSMSAFSHLPLPFPLQKLGPRLPKTFYDVGYESVSAPGPLFGKVTWTSTAMAEGEEVLPLPTSGDEGW